MQAYKKYDTLGKYKSFYVGEVWAVTQEYQVGNKSQHISLTLLRFYQE